MAKPKVGRPIKFEDKPLYFGMKVTAQEKAAIKHLAQLRNQPASQVILELVSSAIAESHPPSQKRLTTAELRQLSDEAQTQLLQRQAQAISEHQEIDAYKSPAGGNLVGQF
ncbi:MAG: hypothetical protein IV090_10720 [Candidatus Sericytochromatia bacterium]|nr:hypothetical protein [Candidatus Sericytochromatia bacterium]